MDYRPLRNSTTEIRLLQLDKSANEDDPITCRTTHISLSEDYAPYTALSYRWGDWNRKASLIVGGRTVEVQENLVHALRELRRRGLHRVWADALCINLADPEERGQQVLRMSTIYRCAETVIAWVGEEPRSNTSSNKPSNSSWQDFRRLLKMPPTTDTQLQTHEAWPAFERLLTADYWTRVWVIQELSVANRMRLIWNRQDFTFEELVSALAWCKVGQKDPANSQKNWTHIERLASIRETKLALKPLSLVEGLVKTNATNATEFRDKVFAILSLTDDGPEIFPIPSYTLSIQRMEKEATRRFLKLPGSLNVIACRNRGPDTWSPRWFDSQSWADSHLTRLICPSMPDLSVLRDGFSIFDGTKTCKSIEFAKWDATKTSRSDIRNCKPLLEVRGAIFDTTFNCSATLDEATRNKPPQSSTTVPLQTAPEPPRVHSATEAIFSVLSDCCYENGACHGDYEADSDSFHSVFEGLNESYFTHHGIPQLYQWLACGSNSTFTINGHNLHYWLLRPNKSKLRKAISRIRQAERARYLDSTPPDAEYVTKHVLRTLQFGMRLCVTQKGRVGWASKFAKPGDRLALLTGCTVPVVLRPHPEGGYWIVGDAIIPGVMWGELVDSPKLEWQYLKIH